MKKFLSVIIALILPITLLCGCSAKQLTADEYKTEMDAAFRGWLKTVTGYAAYYSNTIMAGATDASYDKEFEKTQEYKSELKKKLNDVEDALDKIDKVGNPPAEYADLHEQLKNGVSIEREWLSLQREMLSTESEEEFHEIGDKINKLLDDTVDESLPTVYVKIYSQWKSEAGEDQNNW